MVKIKYYHLPLLFVLILLSEIPFFADHPVPSSNRDSAVFQNLTRPSGYFRLKEALEEYQNIFRDGGWLVIPDEDILKPGMTGNRIALLNERLKMTGDLPSCDTCLPEYFGKQLEKSLQSFQLRHGLAPTGVADPKTLAELNIPVQKRIRQLEINLKRLAQINQESYGVSLFINIPSFQLEVIKNGNVILKSKAVVGRLQRMTPELISRVSYLILNPYWIIPENILLADILPLIENDSTFLETRGIRVLQKINGRFRNISSGSWLPDSLRKNPGTFRLIQDPGPDNAMGLVKFMFPNRYDIYIHDTPAKELFETDERTFSSGCIRIHKAIPLVAILMDHDKGPSYDNIIRILASGKTTKIILKNPVPVYIMYLTAWVDDRGIVNFRKDIYNRDTISSVPSF